MPPDRALSGRLAWAVGAGLAALAFAVRAPELGRWCFSVDEYYSWRASQFVLERGAPIFPAGAIYSRGLLFHYVAALVSLLVEQRELALRIVPLLSGVAVVPLYWRFALRVLGPGAALATALALALSSWEVEMSRFGRMYAPIQLVFVACVLCLHRGFLLDERRWRVAAWALAFLALLVHEEAILLVPLFVLVPMLARRRLDLDPTGTALPTAVLLAAAYATLWRDYQLPTMPPALPEGMVGPAGSSPLIPPRFDLVAGLPGRPDLAVAWLGWVGLGLALLRRIRPRTTVAKLAIAAAMGLAAVQQMGVALLGVAIVGLVDEPARAAAWRHRFALGAWWAAGALLWLVVGVLTASRWHPDASLVSTLEESLKATLLYPEVVQRVLLPLYRPTPWLAIVVFGAVAVALGRALASPGPDPRRLPLVVVLAGMAVVSWIPTPYYESRYCFVLYPFGLCVVWIEAEALGRRIAARRAGSAVVPRVAAWAPLLLFLASGDFHPGHLWEPGSRAYALRVGPLERYQRHWYPRADFTAPAAWVNAHARPGDVVVSDAVPTAAYLDVPHVQLVRSTSSEFQFTSSRRGTRDRWSDGPLVHRFDDLAALVPDDPDRSLWLISVARSFGGFTFADTDGPAQVARGYGLEAERVYSEPEGRLSVWRWTRPRAASGEAAAGRDARPRAAREQRER